MYIHIGGSYTVSDKYILGVFDFDGTTGPGSDTIQFLRKAEKEERVETISFDLPRSFIVTLDRIYYSPIAAATIRLRMERAGQAIRAGKWLHETDERILAALHQNEKTIDRSGTGAKAIGKPQRSGKAGQSRLHDQ